LLQSSLLPPFIFRNERFNFQRLGLLFELIENLKRSFQSTMNQWFDGFGRLKPLHFPKGRVHCAEPSGIAPKILSISVVGIIDAPNPVMALMRPFLTWRYIQVLSLPTMAATSANEYETRLPCFILLDVAITSKASRVAAYSFKRPRAYLGRLSLLAFFSGDKSQI
jgi:hypothetical protein